MKKLRVFFIKFILIEFLIYIYIYIYITLKTIII